MLANEATGNAQEGNGETIGGDDVNAADWGLGGETDESGAPSRVLNQDEIDSLLGFDTSGDGDGANTGINAILDKALMAYERLPMLEVVFDRLVRMMSTSLRNFLSDNVDVSIDSMHSLRFGDYLNSIPLPALLFVFKAQEWENFGLVTVDSALIYSAVDVLLGGRRANRPVRIEGRPYTTIEQELVKRMVEVALADMSAAFDPISPVTFHVDRLETNPRFATIARPGNASILIRLRVDMEERGGNLEILLPHATLEPIRDLLLQMFMGEKFGRDSIWETYLSQEVRNTEVTLEAVLSEKLLKLGDVFNFKVGSTILLDNGPDDDIGIVCAGTKLFTAGLGRVENTIAVKVKQKITPQEGELV
ncbi:flagellar motor switch protein FliM [bacterium]|nr:flagellar motor switch protein FliM [bacterium]